MVEKPSQLTINAAVRELHRLKNEINQAIRNINTVPSLEIYLEVLETKTEKGPPEIAGIEISVKQEVYP